MIQNEIQYKAVMQRIDQLLDLVGNETPPTDPNFIELDLLSEWVEHYESIHYPIVEPNLADTIKLRMYEMNLTQAKVSELIGVSPSRVSEYLTGKSEPTLKVARNIAKKLNISANIILGV
ncbi:MULTISPECIES: helix-turn-helix domain-containing protein [Capnocytophaga]|uniref:helix-turn-helix domain-containing protein n=1 Tax=Capnocytophaga TaxID=1016 RepID=UPI001562CAC1|nr:MULTISPECIES: helix-turn-helix domain-containing protein [Capnocytophaga]